MVNTGVAQGNQRRQPHTILPREWNDPMLERRRLWDDPDILLNKSNIEITEHNGDNIDFVLTDEEIHRDLYKPFYGFLGVFPGFFPGMFAIRTLLVAKWNVACTVQSKSNGFVMFKFNSAEDRDSVMNGPDHYLHGKKLFMSQVAESGQYDSNILATKPVWIRMEHLPKTYWHRKALEKIATSIGEPILMDNGTLELRGYYARLLIWIDTSKQLKEKVSFRVPTGEVHTQNIIYDYCRPWCSNCGDNTHLLDGCEDYWISKEEEPNNSKVLKHKKGKTIVNEIWVKKTQADKDGHSLSVDSVKGDEKVLIEDAISDNENLERSQKGKGKLEEQAEKISMMAGVENRNLGIVIRPSSTTLEIRGAGELINHGAGDPANRARDAQAVHRVRSLKRSTPRSSTYADAVRTEHAIHTQLPAFGVPERPLQGAGKLPEEMTHPETRGSKPPRKNKSDSKKITPTGTGATTRSRSKSRTRVLERGKVIHKPYQRMLSATRSNSDSTSSRSSEGGGPKAKGTSVPQ